MSTPAPPRLMPHHAYKSWTTTWHDHGKHRRTKRFGKQGEVSAKLARARFDHWMETQFKRMARVGSPDQRIDFTVAELAMDFAMHARNTYQKNGKPTKHVWEICAAMDSLTNHYGPMAAGRLEAPHLAKLRDAMIWTKDRAGDARALAMKTVNGRLSCIKQAFKWARERGLVPRETVLDLGMVKPLARGRTDAGNSIPVLPVEAGVVRKTLRHCPKAIRAMIRLQWLTGMRPGEVCIMRPMDIEKKEGGWIYRPAVHKTEHLNKRRFVAIGPKSYAIIRQFMNRSDDAYLFTPAEVVADRLAAKHAARKTPENQGNAPGTNRRGSQKFQPCYNNDSYRKAIVRAIAKGNKIVPDSIPAWHPNQLRHSWATRVREKYGVEEASVGLGHASLSTTEIYAEKSLKKAISVAMEIG